MIRLSVPEIEGGSPERDGEGEGLVLAFSVPEIEGGSLERDGGEGEGLVLVYSSSWMDNNGQQSAMLHASVMPFFMKNFIFWFWLGR